MNVGDEMDWITKEQEEIKKEVLKQVKVGQLITYIEFLELYKPYAKRMSEIDFANILGINYRNYQKMRTQGTRTKIFKKNYSKLTEEEKDKIKQEILEKVKVGQLITYIDFLELYKPYDGKMSEIDFANLLGISYISYQKIRNQGTKAKIFNKMYSQVIAEKIKKEVLKQVKEGQLITYIEFLELYKPYEKQISEIDFAHLLGIGNMSYYNIKNQGTRAKIFNKNNSELADKEKEEIKQEILKQVKEGQLITYIEFLELYKPYKKRISEIDFANLLGINSVNYQLFRAQGTRTKIFKKNYPKLTEEEKDKIKQEILEKVKVGQLITYTEFFELYKPYDEKMSEIDFAHLLGISYSSYRNMQYKGSKTKIFKKINSKLTEKEEEKIVKEVLKQVKIGQSITYIEFLELYKPYKEKISEIDFAHLLGITYPNYQSIRNQGTKAIIKDYKKEIKINRIKYLLKESRYYEKQELENLSKKYEIDLSEILKELFNLKNNKNLKILENCLEIKGYLWIGNIKCSKIFATKYKQYMIESTKKIKKYYCTKYRNLTIKDDVISNSIIFIIEKCGSIEKNCINDEQIKTLIFYSISGYIIKSCLWEYCKKNRKNNSLLGANDSEEEINLSNRGIDTSINTENDVNLSQNKRMDSNNDLLANSCLKLLKKYLKTGYDENKAILEVSKIVDIDVKELLEILKKYMIEQQYVKVTSKGSYILK